MDPRFYIASELERVDEQKSERERDLNLRNELADSVALGEYVNALLTVKEPKMSSKAGQEALEDFGAKILEFGMKYKRELRNCSAEPAKKVAAE